MEEKDEFESLIEKYTVTLKKGDLVDGKICSVDSNGAYVDIAAKAIAYLPIKECDVELKKGDVHQCLIVDFDEREERFELSQKKVHQAFAWKELEKIKQADDIILGEVSAVVKGGLIVELMGIKGFVPSSQILLKGKDFKIGDKIELKILTLDPEKDNFILSNKKVHSDMEVDAVKNVFAQVEVGQVVKGQVVRIADFGAFVDIGGVDGLLPLSQMSWRWVEHPNDVLKLGDKLEVEIITVDKEKGRISLSLKSLQEDPWIKAKNEFKENDVVEGVVTRVKPFGFFVEVYPGVEALLPLKESDDDEDKRFTVGEKIKVKIIKMNFEDKRISLAFA